ncbi:hypothetical protein HY312_04980 [Candidatus Saccharibacteria bacterium]|nr:hypothetical protein [Candidatus Saccharibacteria bacterium]
MTSFEQNANQPLSSPESAQALDAYCEKITDQVSPEERLRRQELIASSALADARMHRDDDQIIGTIDVEA